MHRSEILAHVVGFAVLLGPAGAPGVVEHVPVDLLAAGPPAVAEAAPSEVAVEEIFDLLLPVDSLPRDAAEVAFYRVTLEPGAAVTYLSSLPAESVSVDHVVAGSFGVRVDGPLLVERGGGPPQPIPPGRELILGPGDTVAYLENEASQTLRNAGNERLEIVGMGLFSLAQPATPAPEPPPGYAGQELGSLSRFAVADAGLTDGPLRVRLERLTVAPGAAVPAYQPADPELIFVQDGTLDLLVAPAGGRFADGDALRLRQGSPVVWSPALATSTRSLRNDGDAPLVLLRLTLTPAAPSAPAP